MEDGSFPEMVTASTGRTPVQSKTTVHGCNSCWCSLSPKTVDVTEMVFVDNRPERNQRSSECPYVAQYCSAAQKAYLAARPWTVRPHPTKRGMPFTLVRVRQHRKVACAVNQMASSVSVQLQLNSPLRPLSVRGKVHPALCGRVLRRWLPCCCCFEGASGSRKRNLPI